MRRTSKTIPRHEPLRAAITRTSGTQLTLQGPRCPRQAFERSSSHYRKFWSTMRGTAEEPGQWSAETRVPLHAFKLAMAGTSCEQCRWDGELLDGWCHAVEAEMGQWQTHPQARSTARRKYCYLSHSLPAPQDAEESDGWKVLAHKTQSWQETEEMSVVGAPYSILITSGICNKTECQTLA